MEKQSSRRGAAPALLGIFLLLLTVKNSEIAANGIKKGLSLAANMLIPALFPFLVLSELMLALGVGEFAAKLLARPARLLFGLTPCGTMALLLGWLCGVPVGTVSAMTLLKNGSISREEFDRLLLFGNTPSTGFLIGAVGTSLFGNKSAGVALFGMTLLTAVLTGIALKIIHGNLPIIAKKGGNGVKNSISAATLTAAVRHGFSTLLQVTGFVLFFSAITECILSLNALPPTVTVLLCGLLELTAGTGTAVALLTPEAAFLLCAFFAGFSGLSICLQIFSVADSARPRLLPYLLAKLTQGGLCLALALAYLKIAAPRLQTAAAGFAELGGSALRISPAISLPIALVSLLLLFLLPLVARMRVVTFYKKGN